LEAGMIELCCALAEVQLQWHGVPDDAITEKSYAVLTVARIQNPSGFVLSGLLGA
jgi:hypothetical protein